MEDSLEPHLLLTERWDQTHAPPGSAPPRAARLNGMQLFAAGGLAGAIEVGAVQPLDMIKTRFQLSQERPISVVAGLRQVVAAGGVKQLYRGILPELLCGIPKSSAMYAAYSTSRAAVAQARGGRDDWLTSFAAGAVSGVPEALVVTPFQVVKVRMQSKQHLSYVNSWQCVRAMMREGAGSFAVGLNATIARNCVWNAVYFSSFAVMTEQLRLVSDHERNGVAGRLPTLGFGFVAGVFATCFNCPFDVVKSRMQAELADCRIARRGIAARLVEIASSEGVGALWKGFVAKSLRMGVGGAIGLCAYEAACDAQRGAVR